MSGPCIHCAGGNYPWYCDICRPPESAGNEIPLRITMTRGHAVPLAPEECEPHTKSPESYFGWDEWAERMTKTHIQRQCRGCGLWAVWEPRDVAREAAERAAAVVSPERKRS